MLEDVHYDKYNQKFGGDGIHEPISWSRWSHRVSEFRDQVIYPVMTATEKEERVMMSWLETLPLHTYETRKHGENQPERTPAGKARLMAGLAAAPATEDDEAGEQEDLESPDGAGYCEEGNDETTQLHERETEVVAKKARTS